MVEKFRELYKLLSELRDVDNKNENLLAKFETIYKEICEWENNIENKKQTFDEDVYQEYIREINEAIDEGKLNLIHN